MCSFIVEGSLRFASSHAQLRATFLNQMALMPPQPLSLSLGLLNSQYAMKLPATRAPARSSRESRICRLLGRPTDARVNCRALAARNPAPEKAPGPRLPGGALDENVH